MKRTVRFEFEGTVYEVAVEQRGDQLVLSRGSERYTVTLLPTEPAGGASQSGQPPSGVVPVTPPPLAPNVPPETEARPAGGAPGMLVAPMTGVVKELKASVGHNVERGQVVLIMEAMKMDIDVQAPVSGVVAEVSVRPGDTVSAKQTLMIIQ